MNKDKYVVFLFDSRRNVKSEVLSEHDTEEEARTETLRLRNEEKLSAFFDKAINKTTTEENGRQDA